MYRRYIKYVENLVPFITGMETSICSEREQLSLKENFLYYKKFLVLYNNSDIAKLKAI